MASSPTELASQPPLEKEGNDKGLLEKGDKVGEQKKEKLHRIGLLRSVVVRAPNLCFSLDNKLFYLLFL